MSTTQDLQPHGDLVLVDYFYESSSGHYDKSRKVSIYPSDYNLVVLEEYTDESNQFKGPSSDKTTRWSIDREELIKLIKLNGKIS